MKDVPPKCVNEVLPLPSHTPSLAGVAALDDLGRDVRFKR